MFKAKVDTSVLSKKVGRAILASPKARRIAVGQVVAGATRTIALNAPRDTNRWARAWQIAGNEVAFATGAGASVVQVPAPVVPSRFASTVHDRLEQDYLRWVGIRRVWVERVRRMEQANGYQKWKNYRDAVRTLQKVGDAEDRAFLALEAYRRQKDGAIVVWGRSAKGGVTPEQQRRLIQRLSATPAGVNAARRQIRLSSIARVFAEPLGGSGKVYDSRGSTFAEVRNMEPHAMIVERRVKLARRAVEQAKRAGFIRPGKAYRGRIANAYRLRAAG